jgi:hypothetical protein
MTNVFITQVLSEHFAVFAGKIDTLDGDANAFAHRRRSIERRLLESPAVRSFFRRFVENHVDREKSPALIL